VAGRQSKYQGLVDLVGLQLGDEPEQERENPGLKLTQARVDALEKWKLNPWDFLTGTDPDTGEPIIKTLDQRNKKNPLQPFPKHLDYVHYLIDWLEGEQYGCIEKCSQMYVTTSITLWALWRTLTHYGHKVLLSKHKEDEAIQILREKMMEPWSHMPEWLQWQWPLRNKPSNRVECTASKSHVLGLPENAAAADARGQTYQVGLIDEAEYQESLMGILSAMLPRANQVFWWSTPSTGGAGVTTFKSYLADDGIKFSPRLIALKKKYAHVQGFALRRNEDRNVTIARIEHTADPAKRSDAWLEATRKPYASSAEFKREILIDRSTNIGRPFHPQFVEFPRRYLLRCMLLPKNTPIVRGWDFGGANPACIWGTWSKKSRRFWVLRELLGIDIDTYQFRDLVRYLSGQLSLDSIKHHTRAMQMLEEMKLERAYYDPNKQHGFPWFEGRHSFLDFAGNEGLIGGRGLQRVDEAKTAADILSLGDIILYSRQVLHAVRTQVVNGLSRTREDGWPGLIIDPACKLLWEGLVGGIVYAKVTQQNQDPSEPAAHAVYSHLYDALGYSVTNMVQLEDADTLRTTLGPDGQIVMPAAPEMQMASYLVQGL